MLRIGDEIPDLVLDAFQQKEIKKIKLNEYRGKWLVLIFYPADFTFVCPTELEEASNLYEDFVKEEAEILSVSADTAFVHKAWHDASPIIKNLKFPMLADPAGKMCRLFGTYIEDEGLSLRATFIVDPEGKIKSMEMNDNGIGRNIAEVLRKLRAIKFVRENPDAVCPAGWQPGEEVIKPKFDLIGKI